jgi:hypothetical protein
MRPALPSRASSFETPLRGPQDEEVELLPLFAVPLDETGASA